MKIIEHGAKNNNTLLRMDIPFLTETYKRTDVGEYYESMIETLELRASMIFRIIEFIGITAQEGNADLAEIGAFIEHLGGIGKDYQEAIRNIKIQSRNQPTTGKSSNSEIIN